MFHSRAHKAFAVAGVAVALILPARTASAAPNRVQKVCEYDYQGGCVHWCAGESTCDHIDETNAPEYRKKACAIWVTTGTMYVER